MKKQVREIVLGVEEGDSSWPPCNIEDFYAWLEKIKNVVPENKRSIMQIEIESEGYYDGDCKAKITIYYLRDETDEEYYRRTHKDEIEKRRWEEKERHEYLRLKAKYGDKP